jgi:hypothetical protein
MLSDRTTRAEALANTYATIDGRTGWARVQQYQRVLEYRGDHPEAGSQTVATEHVDRRAASRPFRVLVELLDAVAPTRCIHRTTAGGALDRSADTDTPRLVAREEVGRGRVGDVHPGSTQDLPAVVGAVPG